MVCQLRVEGPFYVLIVAALSRFSLSDTAREGTRIVALDQVTMMIKEPTN